MLDKLICNQLTTVGDRAINQDHMTQFSCSEYGFFVVADGLGGHYGGEKASQFFCQGLFKQAQKYQQLLNNVEADPETILTDWASAAVDDMALFFTGDERAPYAYTTAAILYLDKNITATIHCGDSRIYRLNEKKVLWRTKDHSVIQNKFEKGSITERDMGVHPDQNRLTRAVSIMNTHQVEVNLYPPIEQGETFILCTDGFWEYIKENDLLQLAAKNCGRDELEKVAKMMLLRAEGKSDNITVQWVRLT